MSEERTHVDDETGSLLAELWSTPVGRRWLLKAGLGSAAAAAAGVWSRPAAAATRRRGDASPSATLQFALGHARGVSGLVLVANGVRHPLVAHTPRSRTVLKARGGLWGKLDVSVLSHHVSGVTLPEDQPIAVSVYGRRGRRDVVVAQLWHVPPATVLALARAAQRLSGSLRAVQAGPRRLEALGLGASQVRAPEEMAQLATIADAYTTAVTLVVHHPQAATKDPTSAGITSSLLAQTTEVQSLGSYIQKMQSHGRDYAILAQATDKDGSPSQIKVGGETRTFTTFQLNRDDQTLVRSTRSALTAGVLGVRDEPKLGAVIDKPLGEQPPDVQRKTWIQPQGVTPQPTRYSRSLATGAGVDIRVKNPGFMYFGTTTKVTGDYANGKVPLRIYNDFVRWAWVYVQYLGKDNQNLSVNPKPTAPDTKYSQSLGLLPPVFTILGVPVFQTNSIDVELNFPPGAHTARLLYCGLGSDILGGGWRQYFPSDAYPGQIGPSDEVLVPALLTALLTIGMTAFALVTNIEISRTWAGIRKVINDIPANRFLVDIEAVTEPVLLLIKTEAFAVTVASGGATYIDIEANGQKAGNIWSILLPLASVIPKVIFSPATLDFWTDVAEILLAEEAADKLTAAIPAIGQVIAVVEAIGDAATLAEEAVETLLSPWVIENEVTLTYKASVTVSHDPCAASFPPAAKSWRLEAKVDGALVLDPVTGSINSGGTGQSTPVQVDVVAPFGGKQIQWSMVLLDATGSQVAAGVSAGYVNDNPDDVPSKVAFSIKQNPAVITARTVFQRGATTTFSRAAGGYSWSDRVVVAGTVASAGVQEVAGAAVATTLGVAGMVWKQGDRFFLRGVPVVQNGKTIELGSVRKEGYARRPFLLFDSFVDVTKCDQKAPGGGNHVLLEPDETSDAYEVRRLSLDPQTGRLEWDPAASVGRFLLPVSAAALHSSGRVVALHTDSGRVGVLEPLSAPLAVAANGVGGTRLASYTAGPGTQIGLLDSPTAVAVTNPGTVLILEAAGPQLAAFDLNGHPVRYFASPSLGFRRSVRSPRRRGAGAPALQFTLPLDQHKTYLDLAVDGASQIYLLYYTGDGASVQDYHLDVYHPDGTPLETGSPGVNVPRIAVDYWRSIYAPNYTPLTDLGTTTPHIDPALRVAEPSLSRFDPTTPATAKRRAPIPRGGLG